MHHDPVDFPGACTPPNIRRIQCAGIDGRGRGRKLTLRFSASSFIATVKYTARSESYSHVDKQVQEKHKNHGTYFVPGLFRGLRVLEVIAKNEKPMTVSEVGRAIGVSRSSAFRLIYTLNDMGFVASPDDNRTFSLGARVLSLGFSFLASQDIIEIARPEMARLRDETGISSHLAILEKDEVLFLECVQSKSGYISNVNVGTRRPAYASPLGWLMLSNYPVRELVNKFKDAELTKLTELTPATVNEIVDCVSKAGAAGYVVSKGIVAKGGYSISAPIFDDTGCIAAAIDISGPTSAFEGLDIDGKLVPRVKAAADSISKSLGYTG